MSVEIRTRNQLVEIYNILNKCSFISPSVEFRELSFIVKSKIKKLVIEKMEDIFKSEDPSAEQEMEKDKFEFSKAYAKKVDGKILYNNKKEDSFGIDPRLEDKYAADIARWNIESKHAKTIETVNKREKEKTEWLSKKIKIEVNKLPKIKDIPPVISSDKYFNENVGYDILVEFLCSEKLEIAACDGEEVQ